MLFLKRDRLLNAEKWFVIMDESIIFAGWYNGTITLIRFTYLLQLVS